MAFATIDYDECKQSSYRGMKLSYEVNGKKRTKHFKTGNFCIDHYNYMRFLGSRSDVFYKENLFITWSSSYDHFLMDGSMYTEDYFNPETGEFMDWGKAFFDKDWELYHDIVDNGKYPRCIHLAQHKNFNMVKAYYKKITKQKITKQLKAKK